MPDKSARRVERPEGGPQGERSESSREINQLDPAFAGVTTYSGFHYIGYWIPAYAGMTKDELIRPFLTN
jgi:hypothetical protein